MLLITVTIALVLIFFLLFIMAWIDDERQHKEHREAMNTVWLRPSTRTDEAYNGWLVSQDDTQTWPHEPTVGYDETKESA